MSSWRGQMSRSFSPFVFMFMSRKISLYQTPIIVIWVSSPKHGAQERIVVKKTQFVMLSLSLSLSVINDLCVCCFFLLLLFCLSLCVLMPLSLLFAWLCVGIYFIINLFNFFECISTKETQNKFGYFGSIVCKLIHLHFYPKPLCTSSSTSSYSMF